MSRRYLIPAALAAAALVAAGCGSSSKSSSDTGSGKGTVTKVGQPTHIAIPTNAKQGGSVTFLSSGDVDFLDPGQDYYTFGFAVQLAVNRTLYTYMPNDSTKVVPDLADGMPQISADKKTITVKIKSGIKYAPPVNRAVTSDDVRYAIERAFTTSVPSGYATSYFSSIEGAPAAPIKISKLKDFPGLQTPDPNTLVIKLSKPDAPLVAGALVMPITVPVPRDYASKFDQKVPTDYDSYVAFTGPYMVKNDPKTGKVTGRDPGKKIEMVRNPNWDKSTDFRPAYLDSITIDEGNSDSTVSARRIIAGSHLMGTDAAHPPASILRRLITTGKENLLGRVPSGGAHWDSMNTHKKPLDNLNVRKAIIAIVDRAAIRDVTGGAAIGPFAYSYIAPGIPGYDESGGAKGFPEFDWLQHPDGGSLPVATKYMNLAAKDGVPVTNGKYTGSGSLTAMTSNTPDAEKEAEIFQASLKRIGFNVKIRQVPTDTLYTKFCGVPKQEPEFCLGIGWVKDFQDPQTMLQPTFDGRAIKPAGNVNWSLLNDPKVNAALDAAAKKSIPEGRYQAFADANKLIVADAPNVLETWDDNFQLESPDVNGVMNEYTTTWDFNFTSVK
jgi:peptide/nickel transport system substrate-binding protein